MSDTGKDDLREKSCNLGVYYTVFIELMHSKDHFDTSLVMF